MKYINLEANKTPGMFWASRYALPMTYDIKSNGSVLFISSVLNIRVIKQDG
jgi:hypothetical protein